MNTPCIYSEQKSATQQKKKVVQSSKSGKPAQGQTIDIPELFEDRHEDEVNICKEVVKKNVGVTIPYHSLESYIHRSVFHNDKLMLLTIRTIKNGAYDLPLNQIDAALKQIDNLMNANKNYNNQIKDYYNKGLDFKQQQAFYSAQKKAQNPVLKTQLAYTGYEYQKTSTTTLEKGIEMLSSNIFCQHYLNDLYIQLQKEKKGLYKARKECFKATNKLTNPVEKFPHFLELLGKMTPHQCAYYEFQLLQQHYLAFMYSDSKDFNLEDFLNKNDTTIKKNEIHGDMFRVIKKIAQKEDNPDVYTLFQSRQFDIQEFCHNFISYVQDADPKLAKAADQFLGHLEDYQRKEKRIYLNTKKDANFKPEDCEVKPHLVVCPDTVRVQPYSDSRAQQTFTEVRVAFDKEKIKQKKVQALNFLYSPFDTKIAEELSKLGEGENVDTYVKPKNDFVQADMSVDLKPKSKVENKKGQIPKMGATSSYKLRQKSDIEPIPKSNTEKKVRKPRAPVDSEPESLVYEDLDDDEIDIEIQLDEKAVVDEGEINIQIQLDEKPVVKEDDNSNSQPAKKGLVNKLWDWVKK